MSKASETTFLTGAFLQLQIQIKRKDIQDFKDEMCQLEDKKRELIKLQEQLKEGQTGHVRELQKRMKEMERNLEQKQREDEEHVEQTAKENLELKRKQKKELEDLRCRLERLQVQVEELQVERETWLQYKSEGSVKDQQKIQKLEKDIAFTQMIYLEISEYFQRSLSAAVEENEQKVAQCFEDGAQLALERANKNLDHKCKAEIAEHNRLKEQVPLYSEKVAALESTIQELEEENLGLVNNILQIFHMDDPLINPGSGFLGQSASFGSHDTQSMDRNIMKISLEETAELVNRDLYPLQPFAEADGGQQKTDATASSSQTPSTSPDLCKMFSSQTNFTEPMHLDLLEHRLLCVKGKSCPLHPPPNGPVDMSEEMTFDLFPNEKWTVTTTIINSKFQQSEETDASVNGEFEIEQQFINFK